ncbi:MAG TPA: YihY/virulence factor BrkB family protein [Ktedonobacteraceae bacterium]|nr:YihY/virulence factor BrkB family protein [Ktedonobacteraceae bacterium]
MTTQTKESPRQTEQQKTSDSKQVAEKDVKSAQKFFTKFNNDWVMTFAAGLAFNLITAIFPILIALIAIAGLIFGSFDPSFQQNLINHIQSVFPPPINQSNVLGPALTTLSKSAGFFLFIAIVVAIFGGSRLFVSIEGYFSIIYHTRQRTLIPQNIMALLMLLLFIILVPLLVFASSIPAIVQSILQATPLHQVPGYGFLLTAIGIVTGFIFTWILFLAIYIVVPNQHISFRNSWFGAAIAAIAVSIYLYLFPFYFTHFLRNDTGQVGFAVILLFFFYYFAVILLFGAEINAFFAEGVRATPEPLTTIVHVYTSHLPTSKIAIQEQAPPTHKNVEPKVILSKDQAEQLENQASKGTPQHEEEHAQHASNDHNSSDQTNHAKPHPQKDKNKSSSPATSTPFILVEVLAGTALAFTIQFFNIKRKK